MYIVICGGGEVGAHLARMLLRSRNEVAVIEMDGDKADELAENLQGSYLVIHGDGCNSFYQEEAGIHQADVFVATTGQDEANLVACEIAQRIFEVPRCIARVNSPKNVPIFREVGIESVSATVLIARLIEKETLIKSENEVPVLAHGKVVFAEIPIGHMNHNDRRDGILVDDIDLPDRSVLVAVVSEEEDVEIVGPDTSLYPGDTVVVAAHKEVLGEVRRVFQQM